MIESGKVLRQRRDEIISMLSSGRDRLAIESVPDPLDDAREAMNRAVAIESQSLATRTLRLVNRALEKIEKLGVLEYGMCENCGEWIDEKRLEAIPWAKYCIECQGTFEGRIR